MQPIGERQPQRAANPRGPSGAVPRGPAGPGHRCTKPGPAVGTPVGKPRSAARGLKGQQSGKYCSTQAENCSCHGAAPCLVLYCDRPFWVL